MLLLLQLSSSFEAAAAGGDASSCAAGAKLLALLRERPYSLQVRAQAAWVPVPEAIACNMRICFWGLDFLCSAGCRPLQVPAEERGSPLAVALVALAGEHCCWCSCSWMSWLDGRPPACMPQDPRMHYIPTCPALFLSSGVLDPHDSSINAEPLKRALREAGALEGAVQLAVEHSAALTDSTPTMHTVRSLWRLQKWVTGVPQWQLGSAAAAAACCACQPACAPACLAAGI
jgi:hypothetical protein